jgi:hypothetical protein
MKWGYYLPSAILAFFAAWVSLTIVPAFFVGMPEFTRGWPKLILLWALVGTFWWAGWSLGRAKRYRYCSCVAGVMGVFVPVGTVISVATILGLRRSDVRSAFDVGQPLESPVRLAIAGAATAILLLLIAALLS